MKTKHLLLLILIAAFSSCSSAYRIGQTPDDVYYSPAPPPPVEYVTTENQQDRDSYGYNNAANSEDMATRQGLNDPGYRSNIALNFGFGYTPYDYYGSSLYSPYSPYYNPYGNNAVTFYSHGYNYYNGYNSYNPYSPFNNYYYSPFNDYYYTPILIYGNSSTPASNFTGPRTYNLGAYSNTANRNRNINRVYNEQGQPATNNAVAPVRTFAVQPVNAQPVNAQPVNRNSGVGNFIRRVFSSSDNPRFNNNDNNNLNNNNNNVTPARTTQTNTNTSVGNSSSSGSSAPVRTFRR